MYERITPPSVGERITSKDGEPVVPDNPIVPYIRGDGTGTDIWPAAQRFLLRP
jgi:isocitrate dehydrogenase